MTGSRAWLRALLAAAAFAALLCSAHSVAAQVSTSPVIVSPADGQTLQGQVTVKGTTDIPNFSSAELAFAYNPDPTDTWFTIQTASLPVTGDVIATWDTTAITDGDYVIRLRVNLQDGSTSDAVITVHVRNYTPTPTPSPAVTPTERPVVEVPTAMIVLPSATPNVPAVAVLPTPSAFPPNPAGVTPGELFSGFWRGALLVGLLVLVFGLLVRHRR
ncbi:MAG TPA: hypothetical protein VF784_05615 [Anaerolineales bacterium]